MNWFDRIRNHFRWTWVGTVEGLCQWTDRGKPVGSWDVVIWNLYERGDGKRRVQVTGDPKWSDSPHVLRRQAAVKAWVRGGPIPQLKETPQPTKPKADLVVFPGGKNGAA